MKQNSWRQKVALALVALIATLNLSFSAFCQQVEKNEVCLNAYSPVYLKMTEEADFDLIYGNRPLKAIVSEDVLSGDREHTLIKEGTPVEIYYNVEKNGSFGKSGKVNLTHASTNTIDGNRVFLNINMQKSGQSYTGFCIAVSVATFPIGLLTGFIKGDTPTIKEGTLFSAYVAQDYKVNIANATE